MIRYVLLGLFCFLSVAAHSQSPTQQLAQQLFDNLKDLQEEFPVEKAFLHVDKPYYFAGDDLWFSVYLAAGSRQVPSPLSKVIYVELLAPDGKVVDQKRIRIEEGRGKGDFYLPPFLREGSYQLRAFSHWMLHFGEPYLFHKDITLFDNTLADFQPVVAWDITYKEGRYHYRALTQAFNRQNQLLSEQRMEGLLVTRSDTLQRLGVLLTESRGPSVFSFSLSPEQLEKAPQLLLGLMRPNQFHLERRIAIPFPLEVADVAFLPEGGHLLGGGLRRVGIRALAPDGKPLKLQGKLIEKESGTLVGEWETNERGIGSLLWQVDHHKTYEARLYDEAFQKEVAITLPQVQQKGLSLMADISKGKDVLLSVEARGMASEDYLVLTHCRGEVVHLGELKLKDGESQSIRIPKANLREGINHVTVFDVGSGLPLAERLLFSYPEQHTSLSAQLPEFTFQPKEAGELRIRFKDPGTGEGQRGGSYSIALGDAAETAPQAAGHLVSELLLNSDLQGKIHQAGYYFEQSDLARQLELDEVLLTQGWRRFDWTQVRSGESRNQNTTYFIEQGLTIQGQITDLNDGKKRLKGGKLTAYVWGANDDFIVTEYDESGRFLLPDLEFADTSRIVIQGEDVRYGRNIKLQVDEAMHLESYRKPYQSKAHYFERAQAPQEQHLARTETRTQQGMRQYADFRLEQGDFVELEEIVVEDRRITEANQVTKMYGDKGAISLIPGINWPTYGMRNVQDYIDGRVAGVQRKGYNILIRGGMNSILSPGAQYAAIFLDNVPIDGFTLQKIPINDVAVIDIYKDAEANIFGLNSGNGVVAVYTKRGGVVYESQPGIISFRQKGFSALRQFYQPKYNEESFMQAPDYRTTLVWEALAQTNENGEIIIPFYHNDFSTSLRLIIQGWDRFGRPLYFEKEFNAEK